MLCYCLSGTLTALFSRLACHAYGIRLCALICAVLLCFPAGRTWADSGTILANTHNATATASPGDLPALQWQQVDEGLHLAEADVPFGIGSGGLALLRIDPARYALGLYSISEYGGPSLTPSDWARQHSLVAVINASMFLPDGTTSTGYMRNGTVANNRRINKRFGSFLVYGPLEIPIPQAASQQPATLPEDEMLESVTPEPFAKTDVSEQTPTAPSTPVVPEDPFAMLTPQTVAERLGSVSQSSNASVQHLPVSDVPASKLPTADLLDRYGDSWETLLPRYRTVVQNFRMISHDRKPLWPEDADTFSIAAIGEDASGHIVFIHCRPQTTVRALSELLLATYPDLMATMYVEGGAQATMHLNSGNTTRSWLGRAGSSFWYSATGQWPLPNVIGVKKLDAMPD